MAVSGDFPRPPKSAFLPIKKNRSGDMIKIRIKRYAALIIAVILTVSMFSSQLLTVGAVVPSKVDYRVFLNGTKIFIHNKKVMSSAIGTEYYFTYTVESVTKNCKLQGLVTTADASRAFPYTDGGFMRYQNTDPQMLTEGATYFVKMTVASGGFRYNVTRAIGDKLEDIVFEKKEGKATDKANYAGLWLYSSNAEATLKNFRFYDKNGNDLGVAYTCGSGTVDVIRQDLRFNKANDIDHRYEVSVDNKYNIAISNVKVPTTPDVYIQYKVESAEYTVKQNGVALSNDPQSEYPHSKGIIKHITHETEMSNIELLELGAEYIIKVEREAKDYTVIVQKTKGGVSEIFIISKPSGKYSSAYDFVSLWFGTGEHSKATFTLTDLLIYDGNRNNLGVQTNVASTIKHFGELEDYAGCEATYYCKENNGFIALFKDNTMKLTIDSDNSDAKYKISSNILTANFDSGEKKYDYLFKRITDEDGKVYERLYTYKVAFETGSDTKIDTQVLSNKTGYVALKPTDPKLEGCSFKGWVTADGKDFDFNTVIVKSTTLYAKWTGSDGKDFISVISESSDGKTMLGTIVFTAVSLVILAAGVLVFVKLIGKGRKSQ